MDEQAAGTMARDERDDGGVAPLVISVAWWCNRLRKGRWRSWGARLFIAGLDVCTMPTESAAVQMPSPGRRLLGPGGGVAH